MSDAMSGDPSGDMSGDSPGDTSAEDRVRRLLEEAIVSGRTPEDVCADETDLLPAVRTAWHHCRRLNARLDDLFPPKDSLADSQADGFRRAGPGAAGLRTARGAGGGADRLPSIPGYVVEAVLGRGGVGVVYRARHLGLGRAVALKMLLSGAYAGTVERARFLREARSVAALRHAHVVQVHDVGEHEGRPYFTMEWMEGGNLAERLGGAPQPAGEAAGLVATLAGAVEAAHRSGVIHRDLKPANVLLAADGTPKVSDFGLALFAGAGGGVGGGGDGAEAALTQSGARLGTPSYMAPEQAAGRRGAVGPAADVYALGAILYEALTGRPPFRGESASETERQVIAEEPVPPSRLNARVPRDLETVCLKCLHKDPARRYASAAALADDLGRWRRGEPVAARRAGAAERAAKWARRRPAVAVALAACLVLAMTVAGGGAWFLTRRAARVGAAEDDLREVGSLERQGAWAEARAALGRAEARVDGGGPAPLRARIGQADRDLKLVARLDAVRLDRADAAALVLDLTRSYGQYVAAFRESGIGTFDDDPAAVAGRIRALDIRPVLVGALDDWMTCTTVPRDRRWLSAVAQHADGDPTDWRARARDPGLWEDKAALLRLAGELDGAALAAPVKSAGAAPGAAPGDEPSVSLLVALGVRLRDVAGSGAAVPFLRRVQRAHPGDFWVNLALGEALQVEERHGEAQAYLRAAVALRPDAGTGHSQLGIALARDYRIDEAIGEFREAARLNPTLFRPLVNIAMALGRDGRYEEALAPYRESLRLAPDAAALRRLPGVARDVAVAHAAYAFTLQALRHDDEAAAEYERALSLDPRSPYALSGARAFYSNRGRWEEALAVWRKDLEADPQAPHGKWHGYAELALFLGREREYLRGRQAVLDRFGASTEPHVAERTGRTFLLRPGAEEPTRRAAAAVDRAVASTKPGERGPRPYYLFAKALAEYRLGHPQAALALVQGEAAAALVPAPQILEAMALQRLGRGAEARVALTAAAIGFDWRSDRADTADAWMYHALRREAEGVVLPDLPRFLEGKGGDYRPRDVYEQLAMTGACVALGRNAAAARLWSDAFASTPSFAADGRAHAVPLAALAGCGGGSDALTDAERARWRERARHWIEEELRAASAGPPAPSEPDARTNPVGLARATLTAWLASPDLAPVRDPDRLQRLPAEERQEWSALWKQAESIVQDAPKK